MKTAPRRLLLASLLLGPVGYCQHAALRWNPEISYSWKASDRYAFSGKTSLRHAIRDLVQSEALTHVEGSVSVTYSQSVRRKLGGGYLVRSSQPLLDDRTLEHRLFEQFALVKYYGDRRLVHRFRTEQRFRPADFVNRWRYRVSYDFPLEGERLDPGERYAILSGEALAQFNSSVFGDENRVAAALGWFLAPGRKLEVGAEYRVARIFSGGELHHLVLFRTSLFVSR